MNPPRPGQPARMFLFFSNRMGCLPSLLLSAFVTLVLLVLTVEPPSIVTV